jgi:hypothetical protein
MSEVDAVVIKCKCGNDARRVFSIPAITISQNGGEVMEKALRGEAAPPGMSKEKAYITANSMAPKRYRKDPEKLKKDLVRAGGIP